jgi:hypothetical protein
MTIRIARRLAVLLALTLLLAPAASARGLGQSCGGLAGLSCDGGLFCERAAGRCRALDLQGTCAKVPEVCTQNYQPVCGCNGKTYGNDCERRAAKVSKDHDGACR